jgi:oxygen-dependent protoporphyrinogen oxidase
VTAPVSTPVPTVVPAIVVGAGISGLVCAYALRKAGIDAQLLEASSHPGGVIRSESREGFLLELGPQSFSSTPAILELCSALGLEDQLVAAPAFSPRYLVVDGALRQLPLTPPAFFTSNLFSATTKWSILRDLFGRSTPPATDESVAAFVRRKFSAELLEKLAGPFVSGIYAGDPEKLSLRAAFPQLHEAEKKSGSLIRGLRARQFGKAKRHRPVLQTFRGGNETLVQRLAASLGPHLRCGVAVQTVQRLEAQGAKNFAITFLAGGREETIVARHLILATPAYVVAQLMKNTSVEFGSIAGSIEYAPIAVVSLGYKKSDVRHTLHGFGFLAPRNSGLRTLGTVWNSSLFPARAPEGYVLLTSFVGGANDSAALSLSAENLTALVHREITPLLNIQSTPVFSYVTAHPYAIPQYTIGYIQRIGALDQLCARVPNLRLVGSYLHGPSIGACIEQALTVARQVEQNRPAR